MRVRTRCFCVLALAALFALLPEPDARTGRPAIVWLQVREWLLGVSSPLATWEDDDGRLPTFAVDLMQSPPLADDGERRAHVRRYADLAARWNGDPPAAATQPVPLVVRIGSDGFRADVPPGPYPGDVELAATIAPTFRLEQPFPTRWSLFPTVLALGLVVLTRRLVAPLLVAVLAGGVLFAATRVPDGLHGVTNGRRALPGAAVEHVATITAELVGAGSLRHLVAVGLLAMAAAVVTRPGLATTRAAALGHRARPRVVAGAACLGSFVATFVPALWVGAVLRPLADRARLAREQLAFLVLAGTPLVAATLGIGAWDVATRAGPESARDALPVSPALPAPAGSLYALCLATLAVATVVLRRDFGPMATAERRAGNGSPAPVRRGLVVATALLLGGAVAGYGVRGQLEWSRSAVLLAAAAAVCVLVILWPARDDGVVQRARIAFAGLWRVVPALVAVLLALVLARNANALAAPELLAALGGTIVAGPWQPVAAFVAAAVIAAAVGNVGAVATALVPLLALPPVGGPASDANETTALAILAVVEGAWFGRYLSPFATPGILVAAGTGCHPVARAATFAPYAALASGTTLLGYVVLAHAGPAASTWVCVGGAMLVLGAVLGFGRPVRAAVAVASAPSPTPAP